MRLPRTSKPQPRPHRVLYSEVVEDQTRRHLAEKGLREIAPSFTVLRHNLEQGDHQYVKAHLENIGKALEAMGIPTRF